jgi:putative hydrolase of the HAD superfamily
MTAPLIIFDLDDTLYLERDFAFSGYKITGDWIRDNHGVVGFSDTCCSLLESGCRERIFDKALAFHGIGASPELVAHLVALYREHLPEIALAPDAERYFARNGRDSVFGIITDGPLQTQKAKVRSLGLDRLASQIVYTASFGDGFSKPHPRAFIAVENWASQFGRSLVYVADNPIKDFVTARKRGWNTVRVCRPERIHHVVPPGEDYEPHASITSLDDLDDCFAALQKMECA